MGPKKITNSNTTSNTNSNTDNTDANNNQTTKAKRGRKSKKELMESLNMTLNITEDNVNSNSNSNLNLSVDLIDSSIKNEVISDLNIINAEQQVIKKRGRKPKGGKIIQPTITIDSYKEDKPNVILHLKCSLKDIHSNNESMLLNSYDFTKPDLAFDMYNNENINVSNYLGCNNLTNNNGTTNIGSLNKYSNYDNTDSEDEYDDNINKDKTKELWHKLKQLEQNLHMNNVNNKKSCCFWDTCEFDGPAVYAPKYIKNGTIYVEGCFCCPQCAAAYIVNKPNIDNSTKFECLYHLNHLYGSIYEYTKNINPAPDPRYMLNKFLGNLTIQQYRSLLGNDRLFLVVDKPLTRILPELHEYNDEFILNNKIIPSNSIQMKARLQKKKQDKTTILNEKFGINQNQMQLCG